MPIIDLVGQSYQLKARNLSSQRTINWFIENYGEEDKHGKSKQALVMTPGAVLAVTLGSDPSAPCRGLYYSSTGTAPYYESRLYGVWGTTVYRFNTAITVGYPIGNMSSSGDAVSMCDNGEGGKFVIVDGIKMYSYPMANVDGVGTLTEVTLPWKLKTIPANTVRIQPTFVCFLGQRLIVNDRYGNQFFFFKLASTDYDFTTNTSFYSAEQSADAITAMRVVNGALFIWGSRSYEIWRTTDNLGDPFSYVGGSSSAIGIKAPASVASIDNKVFWLGASDVGCDTVYMGESQTIERISTNGIEDQILSLSNRDRAIGWCYSRNGNTFYILSFIADNRTFCYEASTGTWTERLGRDILTQEWKVYPYVYGTFARDHVYCGTLNGNVLAYLDDDTYVEWNGDPIVRQRISPVYFEDMNNIMIKEILVDGLVGNSTLLSGQGSDPLLLMEVSKDGGSTYGNTRSKSIGKQGNYRKVVRWNALGIGREIVFKFTFSDPIPYSIYQARLDYAPCART